MNRSRTAILPAALATLTAAALLAASRPGGAKTPNVSANPTLDSVTVVVHMTGLLLVVPPTQRDGGTTIVLPQAAGHVALLGFGRTASSDAVQNLCLASGQYADAYRAGICYVNLDQWSVLPFGENGGRLSSELAVPAGLMDVTDASGGDYKVPLQTNNFRSVVFKRGWFGPTTCSLANWTYTPVTSGGLKKTPRTRPLYNLVDWEIRHPANPRLEFVSASGVPVPVELPVTAGEDRIELLLAHVPIGDQAQLPPAGRPTPAGAVDSAAHFHAYYNLLRKPGNPLQIPNKFHRPVPRDAQPTTVRGCFVRITVEPQRQLIELPPDSRAIGTYACMPATGEGP